MSGLHVRIRDALEKVWNMVSFPLEPPDKSLTRLELSQLIDELKLHAALMDRVQKQINYPQDWNTEAYPTLESALAAFTEWASGVRDFRRDRTICYVKRTCFNKQGYEVCDPNDANAIPLLLASQALNQQGLPKQPKTH